MVYTQLNSTQLYCDILAAEQLNSWIAKYTSCPEKVPLYFFAITLPNPITDLQNSFTFTLSSKFAINKSLNISPSFTHVATLPCKTVVLKNYKSHCRPTAADPGFGEGRFVPSPSLLSPPLHFSPLPFPPPPLPSFPLPIHSPSLSLPSLPSP